MTELTPETEVVVFLEDEVPIQMPWKEFILDNPGIARNVAMQIEKNGEAVVGGGADPFQAITLY